jgi:hypothetical protein
MGGGLAMGHLKNFKAREAFYKSREVNSGTKGWKIDFIKIL